MKRLTVLIVLASLAASLIAQEIPQGFTYQAILRDASGSIIANEDVTVELSVQDINGLAQWIENHSVTTNQFGLISLVIGQGTRTGGTVTAFGDIDWTTSPVYINNTIEYDGQQIDMGTSGIYSVPYSLVAGNALNAGTASFAQEAQQAENAATADVAYGLAGELNSLNVVEDVDGAGEEALFEVRNNTGQTIFAVYNEGVEVYFDDSSTKGVKGSFAVKGFGSNKGEGVDYLLLNSDSTRIYLNNDETTKGIKGSFAVGSFNSTGAKAPGEEYLRISQDSARIYINNEETVKGIKGSFAVGSFNNTGTKSVNEEYLRISRDSARIYINDSDDGLKGIKGSFAVQGFGTSSKGDNANYFDINMDETSYVVNPAENRILWYPYSNAFLVGKVLISDPANVGENSFVAGFESRAKGNYSQAMGYQAYADGLNSTSIGQGSLAIGDNSYAFGQGAEASAPSSYAIGMSAIVDDAGTYGYAIGHDADAGAESSYAIGASARTTKPGSYAIGAGAQATGQESYAIGRGAIASGTGSFAFGSAGLDSLGNTTGVVQASGSHSLAIGQGARAYQEGSIAIGVGNSATNKYSTALGYETYSSGHSSFAAGSKTRATNSYSTALGYSTTANGFSSTALGWATKASLNASFAAGYYTEAKNFMTTAMGVHATASGHSSMALGSYVTAESFGEIAIGMYNTDYAPLSTTYSVGTDRLFVIGNGTYNDPSNALVVLKNGHVGIDQPNQNTLNQYSLVVGSTNRGLNVNTVSTGNTYSVASTATGGSTSTGYTYAYYGVASGAAINYGLNVISGGNATTNYGIYSQAYGASNNYAGYFVGNVYATGAITQNSDIRYKTDINNIENSLDKIMSLNGVTYNWKNDDFPDMHFDDETHIGVIAQEVEEVLPELVLTDENGYKSVSYANLTPVLIEAVKEQQGEIEAQQDELASLKAENEELKARIKTIEALLDL